MFNRRLLAAWLPRASRSCCLYLPSLAASPLLLDKLTAAGPSVAYFLQPSDDAVPVPAVALAVYAVNLKCNLIQIPLQNGRGEWLLCGRG